MVTVTKVLSTNNESVKGVKNGVKGDSYPGNPGYPGNPAIQVVFKGDTLCGYVFGVQICARPSTATKLSSHLLTHAVYTALS